MTVEGSKQRQNFFLTINSSNPLKSALIFHINTAFLPEGNFVDPLSFPFFSHICFCFKLERIPCKGFCFKCNYLSSGYFIRQLQWYVRCFYLLLTVFHHFLTLQVCFTIYIAEQLDFFFNILRYHTDMSWYKLCK